MPPQVVLPLTIIPLTAAAFGFMIWTGGLRLRDGTTLSRAEKPIAFRVAIGLCAIAIIGSGVGWAALLLRLIA